MRSERELLRASVIRHGEIDEIGQAIESGGKPSYETFVALMEGKSDPGIEHELTEKILLEKIEAGELSLDNINVIIHSPARRAEQTAQLLGAHAGTAIDVRPSDYLREVRISMKGMTAEEYGRAPSMHAVREKFMRDFFEGRERVDESPVDVFRRAQRFLEYLRKTRTLTTANPLYVSHGIFSRFLQLAIEHQGQEFSDAQAQALVRADFFGKTKRPGNLGGLTMAVSII